MTQLHEALTPGQIEDGLGAYTDAVAQAGLEVIPDAQIVPTPNFTEVTAVLGVRPEINLKGEPTHIDVPRTREAYSALGQYPGLRVLVGQRIPSQDGSVKEVLLPGIVLPTKAQTGYANVGCLTAPNDIIFFPDKDARRPLSDLQHALLMQTYAMHSEGVGAHGRDGQLNPADVAHAAIIVTADSTSSRGLHTRTHEMVDNGLAPSLTKQGSLDIAVSHDVRQVREGVIGINQATRLVVNKEHQVPTGQFVELNAAHGAGAAAIALTLAAGTSRNDPATRDLSHKLDLMQEEMNG